MTLKEDRELLENWEEKIDNEIENMRYEFAFKNDASKVNFSILKEFISDLLEAQKRVDREEAKSAIKSYVNEIIVEYYQEQLKLLKKQNETN